MTKERERAELHRTIRQIANDLRGAVDGWDFKAYVLGFLFYRFISENLTAYVNRNEAKAGNPQADYAKMKDSAVRGAKDEIVKEKGFFILPSELFENVRANADPDNINEVLSTVFRNIENSAKGTNSEDDLRGLFDDIDVNSARLGHSVKSRNQRLIRIMNAIGGLNLGGAYSGTLNDTFGDAYEYLLAMYASGAGKSGGEFFTPQEVAELLARIVCLGKKSVNKVYDPACGSGSLLLKFAKFLGKNNVKKGFFGQEINLTTYNLCRINMFLHDINFERFDIALGDTLVNPSKRHIEQEPFDAIVSNPPYSTKWEGDNNPVLINDPRFSPAGVLAPKSKADLAFTMHMLSWLSTSGTAAIVEFPGVLYRGGAEGKIRKYLIENNFVDAVIQLPPDIFFGTTIATCIIVLKKSKADNHVLFIDASELFVREGNKNKLTEENIGSILEAYEKRCTAEHFAQLVKNADIAQNDFNLSVSAYIEQKDTTEQIDIRELNKKIDGIVKRQNALRREIDAIVADLEKG